MGQTLMTLKPEQKIKENMPLFRLPLQSFMDIIKSFKFMCTHDNISIVHFEQLFGVNEKYFHIWDKEGHNNIDSFEIFSTMIILSNINIKEKLISMSTFTLRIFVIEVIFNFFDTSKRGFLSLDILNFLLSKTAIGLSKLSENFEEETPSMIVIEIDNFIRMNHFSNETLDQIEFIR